MKICKVILIFNNIEIPDYIDRNFLQYSQRWDVVFLDMYHLSLYGLSLKSHNKQNDASTQNWMFAVCNLNTLH